MQEAMQVLQDISPEQRSLKSANEILRSCLAAKNWSIAASLLDDLETMGLEWDDRTWYLALRLQVRLPCICHVLGK